MPKRLMIVDDSPVMRAFVRRTVEVTGLEVTSYLEAGDGREALTKLRSADAQGLEHQVDLILTDINMPVMDGEGLLEELRRDHALCSIPVIVVSTDSTDQRMGKLLELGARSYVRKPFPPEKLGEVLADIFPELAGADFDDSSD
ncbi:response regulator [uncultured Paludibaculum sp.]|uniref:response regulator n=1 Tax=uncultured Paludibaculum sp. TaxID=1765020 RepID=UPI002AABB1D8|nr:response regulator [uncultured Paludibaculum sp.]